MTMADNDFNRHDRPHDTGTHIHVEKKKNRNWLWLLVPLILGALVLPNLMDRDDENRVGSTVERNEQVAAVTYQGQTWQPRGDARTLAASEVQSIGKSAEGYDLYRSTGGGGGMGDADNAQVFMKTSNGLFQPLARVGETGDGNRAENPND
jgi:hypothetical protein